MRRGHFMLLTQGEENSLFCFFVGRTPTNKKSGAVIVGLPQARDQAEFDGMSPAFIFTVCIDTWNLQIYERRKYTFLFCRCMRYGQ